jgi:hypothetical protein
MNCVVRATLVSKCFFLSTFLMTAIVFSGSIARSDDEESFSEEQLIEEEAPAVNDEPKTEISERASEESVVPPVEIVPAEDPLKENSELASKENNGPEQAKGKSEELKNPEKFEEKKQEVANKSSSSKVSPISKLPPKITKKEEVSKSSGSGFRILAKNCPMRREPASESKPALHLKPGRKIWISESGPEWFKALDRDGKPVFFDAKCFEN